MSTDPGMDHMAQMGAFESSHDEGRCVPNGFGCCMTHPTCDHVRRSLQESQAKVADQQREIRARGEILDTLTKTLGAIGNYWSAPEILNWRQNLRDFAEDSELHQFEKVNWRVFHENTNGITLYQEADYFTAYHADASELWERRNGGLEGMRINVYSQEITREISIVSKPTDKGLTYYGVRMYLASPDILHHTPDDDDRSAITFWIPNSKTFSQEDLAKVFDEMAAAVRRCPKPMRND